MKLWILLPLYICLVINFTNTVESATIFCKDKTNGQELKSSHEKPTESSTSTETVADNQNLPLDKDIHKFINTIQCTLEKAKPLVTDLQKEVKRLEEAAKNLGLGIINTFGAFVDRLVVDNVKKEETTEVTDAVSNKETTKIIETSTEGFPMDSIQDNVICPDGFVADHNGICSIEEANNLK